MDDGQRGKRGECLMPSSAHYHTAGIGRGHRQGLQQEDGIGRRWQEHPTMSGSWKVLALGRIAQHPEGAWPAWPPTTLDLLNVLLSAPGWSSSWAIASTPSPASSVASSRQEPISGAPPTPSVGLRPMGRWAPCPLQRCCLGVHPMSSITVLGGVGFGGPCLNHLSSLCPIPGRDLEGVLLPPPWGTGTL